MPEFSISLVTNKSELEQIILIQQNNIKKNISLQEAQSEGFVTVEHTLDLLYQMHLSKPSVVAKINDTVVGYALVMTQEFCHSIEVLKPMFRQFDKIIYNNKPISSYPYFVMGQICIDKNYRKLGIFNRMYQELFNLYANEFKLILTEVSSSNQRSVQAHINIRMQECGEYIQEEETWKIFLFDLQNPQNLLTEKK